MQTHTPHHKHRTHLARVKPYIRTTFGAFTLILLLTLALSGGGSHTKLVSSETSFTDPTNHDMQIVPASGASEAGYQSTYACSFNGGSVGSGSGVTAYQSTSVPYGSSCVSEYRSCSNGTLSGSYPYASCSVVPPANCTAPWGPAVTHGSSVTAYQSSSVAYGSSCVSESRTCNNGSLSGTYTNSGCSVAAPANCTFNGSSVPHGFSVTAYQTATVSYGNSCASQTRSCSNGTLSGAYAYSSCDVVQNCTVTPPYSQDNGGYVLTSGAGYYFINKFGLAFCVSNTRGTNYFIPAATVSELTTFYNAAPGVTGVTRTAP